MIELLTHSGFLLLGLLTGFGHCLGMCSPFVLWIADGQRESGNRGLARAWPHLQYGLGRILTYTALGTLAGLLGSMVELAGSLAGIQKAAAVGVGVLLILYSGYSLFGKLPLARVGRLAAVDRWVRRMLKNPPRRPFVLGLVLGLLPCGPLYGALIASAGAGSVWRGATGLALFGLGTLPAMLGLGLVGDLATRHRAWIHLVALLLMLFMGVWFIWQGIRL